MPNFKSVGLTYSRESSSPKGFRAASDKSVGQIIDASTTLLELISVKKPFIAEIYSIKETRLPNFKPAHLIVRKWDFINNTPSTPTGSRFPRQSFLNDAKRNKMCHQML
ncbi:hypothetical protein TNCV_3599021 [Trichonephila clavipes]|nr:hypothetical protein TNCV_3599021 [Trichonephila clavipes]